MTVMKVLKIAGLILGGLVVALVVLLAVAKVVLDMGYFSGYDASAPLEAAVTDIQKNGEKGFTRTAMYFNGWRDARVPGLLLTPDGAPGPLPCVVFLHGIGQDKEFVDEDFNGMTIADPFLKAGFAFATFDQYMRGERRLKDPTPVEEAMAFRLRPAYTVNDARRLIDYLLTRPDIAPNRIYLAGASYGAITGSTVAAFDKRIQAVALCYGGGNVWTMLSARLVAEEIRKVGVPLPVVQFAGWYLLSPCDPAKYIKGISPRPLLMQNGTDDCLIATEAAKILQNAAPDPKVVKWYEGDHIGMDPATVIKVLDDILVFFKEADSKIAGAGAVVVPAA